mgnify:CR=1 FL=1
MKSKKMLLMIPLVVVLVCLYWFVFKNDFSRNFVNSRIKYPGFSTDKSIFSRRLSNGKQKVKKFHRFPPGFPDKIENFKKN